MIIGLLSAAGVALYAATVTVLALTATFARRPTMRREARTTLVVLIRARGSWGAPAVLSADPGPVAGVCLGHVGERERGGQTREHGGRRL
ncbi:hypothetical protein CTZ27_26370 [Streptomyces griseocarneus]|nr:hypothetical protein CTZ27_26370 [Streptomyces griseocarneus]